LEPPDVCAHRIATVDKLLTHFSNTTDGR